MTFSSEVSQEQHLASLLDRELESMRELRDILKREESALVAGDLAELEQITQTKIQILGRQADAAERRREGFLRTGYRLFDPSKDAPQAPGDALEERHLALRALAEQCHEANRHNGRVIARKQQRTSAALNILRQSDVLAPTYSGMGSAVDTRSSRLLGKA